MKIFDWMKIQTSHLFCSTKSVFYPQANLNCGHSVISH